MSIKLPQLISNGMVLQRNADVKLWGTADEPVIVSFLGQQYNTLPDKDGKWELVLKGLEPGGPFIMKINDTVISDVYIGDVWLCSGQSNMQMRMQRPQYYYPEELQNPDCHVHQFAVPQRAEFAGPMDDLEGGEWIRSSPDTIRDITAAGYFFAKRLYESYRVPIGLLLCAIGGTPVHAWMSRHSLRNFPELLIDADNCLDKDYVARETKAGQKRTGDFLDGIDKSDPGLAEKWFNPDYDDSEWEERELLEPWTGTGSVWFRRTLDIKPESAGRPAMLFLGTIVDADTVYVNGEKIGETTYRYPPRYYHIPSLPSGRCCITIRVICRDGGFFTPDKQYVLSTENGSYNLNNIWRFRRGGDGILTEPETAFHYKPASLYNGMLAALCKYAIRGTIWYQGESDAANPNRYGEKFRELICGWRKDWGYDFPFIFVELPYWGEGPNLRLMRRQQWLALDLPNTAMAAAADLGEHNDIHPLDKQNIGLRLARCAMRLAYGEKMPPSPFEIIGVTPASSLQQAL